MLKSKIDNKVYASRKEAKQKMGHAAYNRAVKQGEIEYIITSHNATDIIL